MVKRNMIHTKRMPEMLSDVTVQPIMFVLLFAFVFGGSIATGGGASLPRVPAARDPGADHRLHRVRRGIGLTADVEKGIVDRFRSLPISRSSVLIGRSVASLIHSSLGIVVMAVTGLAIGWRIRGGVAEAVLGFALILLFGFGDDLVRHPGRLGAALGGGGQRRDVHRAVPDHVPGQHLRADRADAACGCA